MLYKFILLLYHVMLRPDIREIMSWYFCTLVLDSWRAKQRSLRGVTVCSMSSQCPSSTVSVSRHSALHPTSTHLWWCRWLRWLVGWIIQLLWVWYYSVFSCFKTRLFCTYCLWSWLGLALAAFQYVVSGPDLRGSLGGPGPRPPTNRGPPTKLAGINALFCYLLVLHF